MKLIYREKKSLVRLKAHLVRGNSWIALASAPWSVRLCMLEENVLTAPFLSHYNS